jgi:CRISPR-associated protein Cmr4
MITCPYILHALSPLHAGTGQGVGLIDLPIARERTTEHPLVPGASLKGVLRDAARKLQDVDVNAMFGTSNESASMVRVSDARVVAFPVKSDRGTFAWATSPYVLLRFARDCGGDAGFQATAVPAVSDGTAITVADNAVAEGGAVTLDGLAYRHVTASASVATLVDAFASVVFDGDESTSLTWRHFFRQRLVIVGDDAFTWFTTTATDVRAHVRIGDSGTVEPGALWYAETLPPETILAGLLQVAAVTPGQRAQSAYDMVRRIARDTLQVGGNATTGAGRVRLSLGGGVR